MFSFFFFNDTATTEIYTLSLHDALPISDDRVWRFKGRLAIRMILKIGCELLAAQIARIESHSGRLGVNWKKRGIVVQAIVRSRSEEHTSELQSRLHLVCRLLLEKKKKKI